MTKLINNIVLGEDTLFCYLDRIEMRGEKRRGEESTVGVRKGLSERKGGVNSKVEMKWKEDEQRQG